MDPTGGVRATAKYTTRNVQNYTNDTKAYKTRYDGELILTSTRLI